MRDESSALSKSVPGLTQSHAVDGRRVRTIKTRHAIVSAVIALQEMGVVNAPATKIASRAGVSLRTIFTHFPTQEALTLAVMGELDGRHLGDIAWQSPSGPLQLRLDDFLKRRVALLDRLVAYRRSAAALSQSPLIASRRRAVRRRLRAEIAVVFGEELAKQKPPERLAVLNAIGVLCDSESWENLRRNYSLRAKDAKRVIGVAITKLLS